ncbi:MAG TPA: hypothetical protein VFR60_00525 [Sphingomicrobium sp.]|nr:hypothetical protein [Sphingomicrobium sp.]
MQIGMIFAAAAALSVAMPSTVLAQAPAEPPGATVTLYRAAPGHQVMLLQWLAQQERAAAAAGVPASQLYVHQNGDSWDYLLISPDLTDAQDDAVDAAAKRLGIPTGPGVGIELRKHLAWHSDTLAAGPTSVAEYLKRIGQ